MKNLFILPTDKPRTYKGGKVSTFTVVSSMMPTESMYNIYITSDEEIKQGDWYITGKFVWQMKYPQWGEEGQGDAKKITLTTDQDLIKDGVQAIDDEFLEWFVKNPSCEVVNVNNLCYGYLGGFADAGYKIIIPKEEPKFDVTAKNYISIFDVPFYDSKVNPLLIDKTGRWPKFKQNIDTSKSTIGIDSYDKQETLEKAVERLTQDYNGNVGQKLIAKTFITIGAKWQAEKSYSEEEVLELLQKRTDYVLNPDTFLSDVKKWFEQFKKNKI